MSQVGCQVVDREILSYFRCPEIYGVHRTANLEEQKCATPPLSSGEIAQNLRLERYVKKFSQQGWREGWDALQRQVYYAIRPILGVSVRKHLQRRALRGWSQIPFPAWPNDRSADTVLETFMADSIKRHEANKIPFIWFWPDGNKSCCIMTHDVEEAAGVRACGALMDLDSGAGLASSFQFVPEERYTASKPFLDDVRRRGFEVNIHDLNHDGRLYENRAEFLRRAEKINRYAEQYSAKGFRSAILYRNLEWYEAFKFSYDMSVPNVAHLDPQRGGCCTIMPYFIGNILELPLTTVQDYSLFNILEDYSLEVWKKQADYIIQNHGLLSFNIHPDYLVDGRAKDTYASLLLLLREMREDGRTYFARPDEVDQWWRQRSQMSLVQEAGQWQIKGAGRDRAVIAYAQVEGEGLSYSF